MSRIQRMSPLAKHSRGATHRKRLRLKHELLEVRHLLDGSGFDYETVSAAWFSEFEPPASAQTSLSGDAIQAAPPSGSKFVGPVRPDVFTPSSSQEWIVRLSEDVVRGLSSIADADVWLDTEAVNFDLVRGLGLPGMFLVQSHSATNALALSSLAENKSVSLFSENGTVGGMRTPNDERFSELTSLHNLDSNTDINAVEAWDQTTGSTDVVVGIIDTGVDLDHPDLFLNIWINQGEIPPQFLDDDGDKLQDIDKDGRFTFYDLNNVTVTDAGVSPPDLENSPNKQFVLDGNSDGRIDASDLLADDRWVNRLDDDSNGFEDDLFGWNFIADERFAPNNPSDSESHGTHIAGTIGAIGNNGIGVAGLNWQSSIMSLKFLDENRQGDNANAIAAIMYATMMKTREENPVNIPVTNNSWGQPGGADPALEAAIRASGEADILFVAAAGNGNILRQAVDNDRTPFFPASFELDNIIAVAAYDAADDTLAPFSNFGATSVDIAAPGVGILSTLPADGEPDGRYGKTNGTSMAVPHVTGVVALIHANLPGVSASDVKAAVLSSAKEHQIALGRVSSGGRLDADAALNFDGFAPGAELLPSFFVDEFREVNLGRFDELEPNDTVLAAQQVDDGPWNTGANPDIKNDETIPHLSISATGNGTQDYFRFNVSSDGLQGIFDIDDVISDINDPAAQYIDLTLDLYNDSGSLIATSFNQVDVDPGSDSVPLGDGKLDPFLEFTFPSAGDYVIGVTRNSGFEPIPQFAKYTLHLSVEDHSAISPIDFFPASNPAPAKATILNVDSVDFAPWNQGFQNDISESIAIPHVSIRGGGDGTADVYQFTVPTPGRAIFDIDVNPFPFASEIEPNNTIEGAQPIDATQWNVFPDFGVIDGTLIPHTRIFGSGDGTVDSYRFTVPEIPAGNTLRGIFDIDGAFGFDGTLTLQKADGTTVAVSDNLAVADEGSFTNEDPLIDHPFDAAGEYIITVSSPTGEVPLSSNYTLHVSVENHPFLDPTITLHDATGAVIAISEDQDVVDIGSVNRDDPFLEFDFQEAGEYSIAVTSGSNRAGVPAGSDYTLHASVPNHETVDSDVISIQSGNQLALTVVYRDLSGINRPNEGDGLGLLAVPIPDVAWSLVEDDAITESTVIPHATVEGTSDSNGFGSDFFSFEVTEDSRAVFDIDEAEFDAELVLFRDFAFVTSNQDQMIVDEGSSSTKDPFLDLSLTPGTYFIEVRRQFSQFQAEPEPGEPYKLHISLENQEVLAGITEIVPIPDGDLGDDLGEFIDRKDISIVRDATGEVFPVTTDPFVEFTSPFNNVVTATYMIAAPGGPLDPFFNPFSVDNPFALQSSSWDPLDFGTYSVVLNSSEVENIDGVNAVPQKLGSFQVRIENETSFIVNTEEDSEDANLFDPVPEDELERTSLRAAIQQANQSVNPLSEQSSESRFVFLDPGTFDLSLGTLDIFGDITIVGEGPDKTFIDAGGSSRVFEVQPGGQLTFLNATVRGGFSNDDRGGGAIHIASAETVAVPIRGQTVFDFGIPNPTIELAQSIDASVNWDIEDTFEIVDSTSVPHATVSGFIDGALGETGDFYQFTVPGAGDRGIFDVDNFFSFTDPGVDLGVALTLFRDNGDSTFDELATVGGPGQFPLNDPSFEFVFAEAGSYVIALETDGTFFEFADYQLHVSIENHEINTTPVDKLAARADLFRVHVRDSVANSGGGIANQGVVTISDSVISHNTALGFLGGGGIIDSGESTTITHTLIEKNASEMGVASAVQSSGDLEIDGSTISGHRNATTTIQVTGMADIQRSTLSGNSGNRLVDVGLEGQLNVINSTLVDNNVQHAVIVEGSPPDAQINFFLEEEPNNDFAQAAPIELDQVPLIPWNLDFDLNITDSTTLPHLTIREKGKEIVTQENTVSIPNQLTFRFAVDTVLGDATLRIDALADLDRTDEFLTLDAEGEFSQMLFVDGGRQQQSVSDTITIPQAVLNTIAGDGFVDLTVTPSAAVNNLGPNSLTLTFVAASNSSRDFYQFDVPADDPNDGDELTRVILDIDGTFDLGGTFDPILFLYDDNEALQVFSNNQLVIDDGSADLSDPFLDILLPAGTYFVEVADIQSGLSSDIPSLASYTLHLSVERHAVRVPGVSNARATLKDSLIAGNNGSDVTLSNGTIISDGNNLLSTVDGGDDGVLAKEVFTEDKKDFIQIDASLFVGPLADNGGPLMTHMLLPGSAAIDRGSVDFGLIAEVEPNNSTLNTVDGAQSLENPAEWLRLTERDPNIPFSDSRPHVTVEGTGDGSFDFYSFTVTTKNTYIFDIDVDRSSGFGMDTEIFLFDSAGNVINRNNDGFAFSLDPGTTSLADSFLQTELDAGDYVLGVGRAFASATPWNITNNAEIQDSTTIPHFSISGFQVEGEADFYQFTVPDIPVSGTQVPGKLVATFDIDAYFGSESGLDQTLTLYDSAGTILAQAFDQADRDQGSLQLADPFLSFEFDTPGEYVIGVSSEPGTVSSFPLYTLHTSLENHPADLTPSASAFIQFESGLNGELATPQNIDFPGLTGPAPQIGDRYTLHVVAEVHEFKEGFARDQRGVLFPKDGNGDGFAVSDIGAVERTLGTIEGVVYFDRDGDRVRDPDEPGFPRRRVFLDLNTNGVFDDDEPSTLTVADDPGTAEIVETGRYRFEGIPAGTFSVSQVLPDNFSRTEMGFGATERVSFQLDVQSPGGVESAFDSFGPSVSGDGRFVAYGQFTEASRTKVQYLVHDRQRDVIAAIPGPKTAFIEQQNNGDFANAQNLDAEAWSLELDTRIASSDTIPHLTIPGTGDGSFDFFKFTVPNDGGRGVFDIDNASFDTELFLFDSTGALLASNDDSNIFLGGAGSTSFLDSFIEHTFTTAGVYTIAVGRFNSSGDVGGVVTGNTPRSGDTYTLHVSVEDRPTVDVETGTTDAPSISADGNLVAFAAVLPGGNDNSDIYVWDRRIDGEPIRVSRGLAGPTNGHSSDPVISADGKFITFTSEASNLVTDDNNGVADIFVYEIATKQIQRIDVERSSSNVVADLVESERNDTILESQSLESFDSNGVQRSPWTFDSRAEIIQSTSIPHVSIQGQGDGSFDYYSFTVTGAVRGIFDIDSATFDSALFLFDGDGELVDSNDNSGVIDAGSTSANDAFLDLLFDEGGTYTIAVGKSGSTGTFGGVSGSGPDPGSRYVLNVSIDGHDVVGAGLALHNATISGDGNFVAFATDRSGTNAPSEVFLWQRFSPDFVFPVMNSTDGLPLRCDDSGGECVTVAPNFSDNGQSIVFRSDVTNIVPGDENGRPDLFVTGPFSGRVDRIFVETEDGALMPLDGVAPTISGDGRYIAFESSEEIIPGIQGAVGVRSTYVFDLSRNGPSSDGIPELEPNDSLPVPQSLGGVNPETWSLEPDFTITSSEVFPHLSVQGTGDGTFDHYSFEVSRSGTQGFFDIDEANFNSQLFLFSEEGQLLALNDDSDSPFIDSGSSSAEDPFLSFTFTSPGTYIIAIGTDETLGTGRGLFGDPPEAGDEYLLHVSLSDNETPFMLGTVELISQSSSNELGNATVNADPATTAISGDGAFVAFQSFSGNLVENDLQGKQDVFVRSTPGLSNRGRSANELRPGEQLTSTTLELFAGESITNLNFGSLPFPGRITGSVFGVDPFDPPNVQEVTVFLDLDEDTTLDEGEPIADEINALGEYTFLSVPALAQYQIRAIAPGFSSGGALEVFMPPDGNIAGQDFGFVRTQTGGQSQESMISGTIDSPFDDAIVSNITVYLDVNDNGKRDPGERETMTDQSGNYQFDKLGAGRQVVRPLLNPGTIQVSPLGSNFNTESISLTPVGLGGTFTNVQDVSTADFDGDGDADMAVALFEGNQIAIRLNQGDGSFTQDPILVGTQGIAPVSIVADNLNNNNRIDLIVANNYSANATVFLDFDPATEQFASVELVPVGESPLGLTTGNFDGIKGIDFAVTNEEANTVTVLFNDGNGGFSPSRQGIFPSAGDSPTSLVAGDFDNDLQTDLAVTNGGKGLAAGTVAILLNRLLVTPAPEDVVDFSSIFPINASEIATYGVGILPVSIATDDFDGDSNLDLTVVNFSTGTASVLAGSSNGVFTPLAQQLSVGQGPLQVMTTNVEQEAQPRPGGDTDIDIVVTNLLTEEVSILRNSTQPNQPITFEPAESFGVAEFGLGSRISFDIADLNKDGTQDIVVAVNRTDTVKVLTNNLGTLGNGARRVFLDGTNSASGLDFGIRNDVIAPTLDPIGNPNPINEDAAAQSVQLTGIAKGREEGPALMIKAESDHPGLIPNPLSQQSFNPVAGVFEFTYQLVPEANGQAVITVTVIDAGVNGTFGDGDDASVEQQFTVTVNAVNDPPEFMLPANITRNEDTPVANEPFVTGINAGGGADESSQVVTFSVSLDDPADSALFLVLPQIAQDGKLTYTPASNANGSATVNVVATDSGGASSGQQSFEINITSVNDAPSFTLPASITRDEEVAVDNEPFVTQIDPGGGADESSQGVTFSVTLADPGDGTLFMAPPTISTDGRLAYTPASNANGTTTVNVVATDSGGASSDPRSFVINITPVNDPPSFTLPASITRDEDIAVASEPFVTSIDVGGGSDENSQVVTFAVTLANPGDSGLFLDLPAIAPDGKLTYTPAENANGSTTVNVVATDSGGASADQQSFVIHITTVNDPPTFALPTSITRDEEVAVADEPFITDISVGGGADEASSQTIAGFSVTLADPNDSALFAVSPMIAPDGRLTYTPANNANGTVTVNVFATDSGGANSTPQSFAINITPVNDQPTFTLSGNQTATEGDPTVTVSNFASFDTGGGDDEDSQEVIEYIVELADVGDSGLFLIPPRIAPDGTLTYRPSLEVPETGTATVNVQVRDSGGTASGGINLSAQQTFEITINPIPDNTAPMPVILPDVPDTTNRTEFNVTLDFGENVNGFQASQLSADGATVGTTFTDLGGGRFTVPITGASEGEVTFSYSAMQVTDDAGNDNVAATDKTVTIDLSVLVPMLSSPSSETLNVDSFQVDLNFGKAINNQTLAESDFTVIGGTASALAPQNVNTGTYSFTVTAGAQDGDVTVLLPAGVVEDAEGNSNAVSNAIVRTIDRQSPQPRLQVLGSDPTNETLLQVEVDFGEAVVDFDETNLTFSSGTAQSVSGATQNTVFVVSVSGVADGPFTAQIAAGAVNDVAGNPTEAATSNEVLVDATRPLPTISATPAAELGSFDVTITFSENVTGLTENDFALTNANLTQLAGSDDSYTATLTAVNEGDLSIFLPADRVVDGADNRNVDSNVESLNHTVDRPTSIILTSSGETVDMSMLDDDLLSSVVLIDIRGTGGNVAVLDSAKIATQTPNRMLTVIADADDQITFGDGWEFTVAEVVDGTLTRTFVSGPATVKVVGPKDFTNPDIDVDVDGSGTATANDALIVINELRARRFSDAQSDPVGSLLDVASVDLRSFRFYDVNGDFRITALDALRVINHLGRQNASSGELISDAAFAPVNTATNEEREDPIPVDAVLSSTDAMPAQSQQDDTTDEEAGSNLSVREESETEVPENSMSLNSEALDAIFANIGQ